MRHWLAVTIALAGCDEVFDLTHVEPPGADPCTDTTVAPATILLTGQLLDAATNAPISGVSVDAQPGGVASTDASGMFAIDVETRGTPLFASLVIGGTPDHSPHVVYYQRPFTTNPSDVSNKLLGIAAIDALYPSGRDPTRGTALISLRDCSGNGVADARIELDPSADVSYQGGGAMTNGTGVAYALGVGSGSVVVRGGAAAPFTFAMRSDEMAIVFLVAP